MFFNAVAVDRSSGRKKQACLYCGELMSKLPRHMTRRHPTEKDVVASWHKLRSRGNYHHNMTVMDVGKGNIIVARKPNQSGRNIDTEDFLPCPYCHGFYRRQELWKHTNGCTTKPEIQPDIQKRVQLNAKLMLFGAMTKSSNMLDNKQQHACATFQLHKTQPLRHCGRSCTKTVHIRGQRRPANRLSTITGIKDRVCLEKMRERRRW